MGESTAPIQSVDLSGIIERLEKATAPDREIDARIDAALRIGTVKMRQPGFEWAWKNFPLWAHHETALGMCGVLHNNGHLGMVWDSQHFTASVDAAMSLAARALTGWVFDEIAQDYATAPVQTAYRWKRYKPDGARQMGKPGRWQKMVCSGDFFKWENCEEPEGALLTARKGGGERV